MLGGDLVSRQGASEREYRTVVGRAYYGAFLAAREKAAISSKTAAVHQKTADYYLGKNQSSIGNRLNQLRMRRTDADYDLNIQIGRNKAEEALKLSLRVLQEC